MPEFASNVIPEIGAPYEVPVKLNVMHVFCKSPGWRRWLGLQIVKIGVRVMGHGVWIASVNEE